MVSQPLRWFDDEQSDLEAAANQAIAACGGDARETVKTLIVVNHFLETELEKLRASVLAGYARLPEVRSWTPQQNPAGQHLRVLRPTASFRVGLTPFTKNKARQGVVAGRACAPRTRPPDLPVRSGGWETQPVDRRV